MKKSILKRIIAGITVTAVCGTVAAAAFAADEKIIKMQIGNATMTVNGTEQSIDENGTAPKIENGRTLLPLRAVLEALGSTLDWDQDSKTITIKQSGNNNASEDNSSVGYTANEQYTFELDEAVNREHVSYNNRYGITIAADLYTPKDIDKTQKHAAIIVGPQYGAVKEQCAGIYAMELAKRGFVTLTFDPAYMGESGGTPRNISSPDIFTENISAGVDYIGMLPDVDREKIGALGVCGSGGFVLSAAQVDTRIKAVATSVMYDMSRSIKDNMTDETLDKLSQQRWVDFENVYPEYNPLRPAEPVDEVPEGLDPVSAELYDYYGKASRGHHPNGLGGFTTTSQLPFINYNLLDRIDTISPRPILFVAGENAHSLYFSEDAYEAASEPKELYIVPDAIHTDLYDNVDKIPFDKFEDFFNNAFNN
ncbi:MAG: stalk domain-containing protein [Clostridia bacterium]|nr:stalk domain-containing protein [Clostridia bacterium]